MSFAEVLEKLPALTVSERELLVRRILELDEAAGCPPKRKRWWSNLPVPAHP